jgi:hypothetical protein
MTYMNLYRNAHRIETARPVNPQPAQQRVEFDYTHQAWVVDGLYSDCGHQVDDPCGCYGREHKGEPAVPGSNFGHLR